MDKVSVIIPIYKIKESYLKKCIQSIIEQSYQNIEIILVDDGSPDRCGVICDEFAELDDRIIVLHQENQGVSAARNNGILSANGRWICFVDADDWMNSDTVERAVAIAKKEKVELVVWNMCCHSEKNVWIKKSYPQNLVVRDQETLEQINLNLFRTISFYNNEIKIPALASPWCHLYERNIIVNNHLIFDTSLEQGEDKLFNYAYHRCIESLAYLNEPMYHYRVYSESTTRKFFSGNVDTSIRVLKKYYDLEPRIANDFCYANAYYVRVSYIALFLIQKFYLHPGNDLPENMYESFKKMVSQEPFKSAIRKMRLKGMRISMTRLRLMFLKIKWYWPLFAWDKFEMKRMKK